MPARPDLDSAIAAVFRGESGRVHATLTAAFGDLGLAEDAVQDAFLEALAVWPRIGLPDRPGAWITTIARRRAIDRLRREGRRLDKEASAVRATPEEGPAERPAIVDDQLRLLFTCCHPSLSAEAQVALTLRLICGLRTSEIARLFLLPEPTIAQRLVRAKAKVRAARIPFRVPGPELLPERLPGVLACVYLVFSEGYAATGGDLIRTDLCDEAIRLGDLVVELLPDEPEARGLLALLLLQDSRRHARLDAERQLVDLEHQDRNRWDRSRIERGLVQLELAVRHRRPGPYQLQAIIAAAHAQTPTWDATPWPTIAEAYAALSRMAPSPVIELNRAVAVAHAQGPAAGLHVVDSVAGDPRLQRHHLLPATRAHLLRSLGRTGEAADAYAAALELAPTSAERAFLQRQLDELSGPSLPPAPPGPTGWAG